MKKHLALCVSALLLVILSVSVAQAQSATPDFTKIFDPGSTEAGTGRDAIGPGSTTILRFDIDNSASQVPVFNVAFSDTLPAAVTIADPASASTDCIDGVLSAPNGGATISLSGARLGAGDTCSVIVYVTSSTVGAHLNTSGALTSSAGSSGTASATLNVDAERPGFSKSFAPSSVALGSISTLTLTFDNTASRTDEFSLSFYDDLPTGMVVATPANASTDCDSGSEFGFINYDATSGSSSISLFANGPNFPPSAVFPVVAAGSSCSASVDVITSVAVDYANIARLPISQTLAFDGYATAGLEVTLEYLAKSFTDDPAPAGGFVTLDFTVSNLDRRSAATNIAFNDPLPAGLTFDSLLSDDCGGSLNTGTPSLLQYSGGGSLASESSCTVSVRLNVPSAAATGSHTNTTGAITFDLDSGPVTGNQATDILVVQPAPRLTKEFLSDSVGAGDDIVLRFTVENTSNTSSATEISFEDELTTFLPVPVSATLPATPCGAGSVLDLVAGGDFIGGFFSTHTLVFTDGSLAAGASCTFDVTLTVPAGLAAGIYVNTTDPITATVDGESLTGPAASDSFEVVSAPRLNKEYTDDPVQPGGTVTLQFTLSHSEFALNNADSIMFTDDLAASLPGLTATGLPLTNVCGAGGDLTGSVGDTLLTFSGATLAPGDDCTFSVTLAVPGSALPGDYTNTTSGVGAVVDNVAATENAASDDLRIAGLTLTQEFIDDPVGAGGAVTLRFTASNLSPTEDVTLFQFSDNLGQALNGLVAEAPLPDTSSCGAGSSVTFAGTTLSFSNGSLLAGASCSYDVTVRVPVGAADGVYNNATSGFIAIIGGSVIFPDNASDTLTVNSNFLALTKEFTNDPVTVGGNVNLQFQLSNLDATRTATNIAFTDDLDSVVSGLVAMGVTASTCDGTVTGTSTISVDGVSLTGGSSCTIDIAVAVPGAAAAGAYGNTTSTLTGAIGGGPVTGAAASDDLEILALLGFNKSFDGSAVAGGTSVLTFTITNQNATAITDLSFTDDLDAVISGLVTTDWPVRPCGDDSVITGTSTLTLSSGSLPPSGGVCSFQLELLVPGSAAGGDYTNTTSALTASGASVADPASADLTITAETLVCEMKTDYDIAACSGTFQAFNLADLVQYVAEDYGRNGGNDYQHLKLMDDLDANSLDIESPCVINTADNIVLSGDFVSLDGRGGVHDTNGYTIIAETACVLSEEGDAQFGRGSSASAINDLLIHAAKTARIGSNSTVDVLGDLTLLSDGDFGNSDARIKSGSVVTAGNLRLEATRSANIGQNVDVTADTVTIESTGDFGNSVAGFDSGVVITADTLIVSASRGATVGQNTTVTIAGDLTVVSTGSAGGSEAQLQTGADVLVGGNMDLSSGNKATIKNNVDLGVIGNLNMDAVSANKCSVHKKADITYGAKTGNCSNELP